jgi:hypothetical protein
MDKDLSELLYIKALAARLGDDQGVIIHHDDQGYIVYKNIKNKTLGIQEDERFLRYPHGQLVSTGVSQLEDTAEIVEAEEVDEEAEEIFTRVKGGPSFKLGK